MLKLISVVINIGYLSFNKNKIGNIDCSIMLMIKLLQVVVRKILMTQNMHISFGIIYSIHGYV